MKVIGKIEYDKYICEVSHNEIEKFMGVYYGKMDKLEVGAVVDLGKGYDFAAETKDALQKTSDFINANKKIVKAITDGIMLCGLAGEQE